MRERTCCFTGHRIIPKEEIPSIMMKTERYIRDLEQKGIIFFGVGGAIGYDTLAAKILFKLRNTEMPHIRVILVYPFDGFISRWTEKQKSEYMELLPQYNKIVRVAKTGEQEAYLQRDRHLVNHSSHCICYCTRSLGGTAYTVRYALKNGLIVQNTASYKILLNES